MKNKQYITVFDIPLGMCLSVENDQTRIPVHPVRDASLTGCRFFGVFLISTERCIPNGMRFGNSIISNLCLYVVYFACLKRYGIQNQKNRSRIVNVAKTTLAMPLDVKKAALTRLRLLCLMMRCWYNSKNRKIAAPVAYQIPNFHTIPITIINVPATTCTADETPSARRIPNQEGMECSRSRISKSSSCKA